MEKETKKKEQTESREQIASEVLAEKQKEQIEKLTADRAAYLDTIFKSNIDDLTQAYSGTQDFPFILEIKKVEYLEAIAFALNKEEKTK
jgi:hypothetical protein